ncbi:MAG: thiosulfate dehydrogenase [Acetobacteraceae bacterium]|nr:thiosulfate dehydrogenase [Acetobacteraceae bacterium]
MRRSLLVGLTLLGAGACGAAVWMLGVLPTGTARAEPLEVAAPFTPPPDSAIPEGKFGDLVRIGEKIFRDPGTYAAAFVGNQLRCSNCHLEAGRLAGASPMWAAYVAYPAYRSKNGHVNSYEERLQGCFRFSMNGKAPKLGDPVLVALESYSYFLAKGLPTGEKTAGRGFPALPKPPLPADYARGAQVYAEHCAACHGAQGLGQSSGGKVVFPPLWGPQSFNWGAGMGSVKNAAEFIRENMPLGLGNTLTVQQAWDVATYMDSQVRPQDPRFVGSVEETRQKFHNTPFSMYGQTVNGAVLGDPAVTPPAGTVPAATQAVTTVPATQ